VNRQIGVEEFKDGVTGDPLFTGVEGVTFLLFEFWDPSITRERFKLETSNSAWILTTRGT